MDEEINIIDTATRNEKIKNFFTKYKKKLIYFLVTFTFLIISYFAYEEYKNNKKDEISDLYNSVTIEHSNKNTEKIVNSLIYIIKLYCLQNYHIQNMHPANVFFHLE